MINIDKILNELTTEEKVCLLSGHKSWFTNKVSRVDLPAIMLKPCIACRDALDFLHPEYSETHAITSFRF